jgi:hypothetical protein
MLTRCTGFLVLAFALLLSTTSSWASAADEPLDDAVDAIWRVRSVTFQFTSPSTYYYCDILQQRVADIMRAVGAGDPMDVKAKCSMGTLINDTTIRIVAGLPIEATDAHVKTETTFNTHTQLVAQTRNWTLPTETTVRRFRALRTEVSFARLDQLHLTPSDCELLQAMSERVFPKFNVRAKNALYCTTGSQPIARPGLVVEALLPMTPKLAGK